MGRANQGVRWAGAGGAIQNMGNRGGVGKKVNSKIINKGEGRGKRNTFLIYRLYTVQM